METIQIKSADEASQGAFVVINKSDFNPELHEPFDDNARDALMASMADRAPTEEQLMAAHQKLVQMNADMELERQRIATESADLEKAKSDFAAASAAAPHERKDMTVADLREALTVKGIEFDHNAKKADLQALLDA